MRRRRTKKIAFICVHLRSFAFSFDLDLDFKAIKSPALQGFL